MNEKTLIILRGLPGSGKSTVSKLLGGSHFEADMFFMHNGEYKFNPSQIKDAHDWCREKTEKAMKLEIDKIVVSNTFTQDWEMDMYYELASEYGYRVHSLVVENRHGGVNEHGVSDDKLKIMKNRFSIKL